MGGENPGDTPTWRQACSPCIGGDWWCGVGARTAAHDSLDRARRDGARPCFLFQGFLRCPTRAIIDLTFGPCKSWLGSVLF